MVGHDTARAVRMAACMLTRQASCARSSAHDSVSAREQHCAERVTKGICRDRGFFVVIGVTGFLVATWSFMSQQGFLAMVGGCIATGLPGKLGRLGHDRELTETYLSRQRCVGLMSRQIFCVATGLGLGLSRQGGDKGFLSRQGPFWENLCHDRVGSFSVAIGLDWLGCVAIERSR